MKQEIRFISSRLLFAAMEEELEQNRQASFTVTGMSMWPLLCHGRDQVILEAVMPQAVKKGDIVLLKLSADKYLLHRVTSLRTTTLQTTGDGNFGRDSWVSYACIRAKAAAVVRKGKTIPCKGMLWRLYGVIWMALFPVRRPLFHFWKSIRGYK